MISTGEIDCDLEAPHDPEEVPVAVKILRRDIGIARCHVHSKLRNDARMKKILRACIEFERLVVAGNTTEFLVTAYYIGADEEVAKELVINAELGGRAKYA